MECKINDPFCLGSFNFFLLAREDSAIQFSDLG